MIVQLGQGMVRPGAWTVGGLLFRAEAMSVHVPITEVWSERMNERAEQNIRITTLLGRKFGTVRTTAMSDAVAANISLERLVIQKFDAARCE